MAKKIKSVALVRARFGGYRLLGVTSIKGHQHYGRWLDTEEGTHVADRDVLHTFPNDIAALEAIDRINKVEAHHKTIIKAAEMALSATQQARRVAIKAAAVMPAMEKI